MKEKQVPVTVVVVGSLPPPNANCERETYRGENVDPYIDEFF
jgi:hypothetical protein